MPAVNSRVRLCRAASGDATGVPGGGRSPFGIRGHGGRAGRGLRRLDAKISASAAEKPPGAASAPGGTVRERRALAGSSPLPLGLATRSCDAAGRERLSRFDGSDAGGSDLRREECGRGASVDTVWPPTADTGVGRYIHAAGTGSTGVVRVRRAGAAMEVRMQKSECRMQKRLQPASDDCARTWWAWRLAGQIPARVGARRESRTSDAMAQGMSPCHMRAETSRSTAGPRGVRAGREGDLIYFSRRGAGQHRRPDAAGDPRVARRSPLGGEEAYVARGDRRTRPASRETADRAGGPRWEAGRALRPFEHPQPLRMPHAALRHGSIRFAEPASSQAIEGTCVAGGRW
jgi:hypothetical protein